ncbi:MAG: hypothetical protein HW416_2638 [Chloroflexi bacterium]|nr:hypothetical protein [Chloroflexota bacterium]
MYTDLPQRWTERLPLHSVLVVFIMLALSACRFGSATSGSDSAPTGSTPTADVESAIKRVIQKSNLDQERSIAARDSSLMRDTSTDAYYQHVARVNQSLIDSGIVQVRLENLEWGPITADGDRATAITFETWMAAVADGRSSQSRDRNVYRLVQQDGQWKIESNEHPDEPSQPSQPRPTPSGDGGRNTPQPRPREPAPLPPGGFTA